MMVIVPFWLLNCLNSNHFLRKRTSKLAQVVLSILPILRFCWKLSNYWISRRITSCVFGGLVNYCRLLLVRGITVRYKQSIKSKLRIIHFNVLAPTGAQEVALSVCPCVRPSVRPWLLWILHSILIRVFRKRVKAKDINGHPPNPPDNHIIEVQNHKTV